MTAPPTRLRTPPPPGQTAPYSIRARGPRSLLRAAAQEGYCCRCGARLPGADETAEGEPWGAVIAQVEDIGTARRPSETLTGGPICLDCSRQLDGWLRGQPIQAEAVPARDPVAVAAARWAAGRLP